MCGIIGSHGVENFAIETYLERLRHRGPDGQGWVTDDATIHGHVRLSLVDLTTASAQPFRYGTGTLSFVGEIWNFRELRTELVGLGYAFVTSGDTEVLAAALTKAFMAAGIECRLPFMHRPLVESVLSMTKTECPPGKKILKQVARNVLPEWVIKRTKETFQGAAGSASYAAIVFASPQKTYRNTIRAAYGPSALTR